MKLLDDHTRSRFFSRPASNHPQLRRSGKVNKKFFRFLALAAVGLASCSATAPQSSCEPMVAQICSSAAEAQLQDGTLLVGYSSKPEESQVVPFVVPLFRQDGVLATEVDCYANTDSHSYSIVQSKLAIPPTSEESMIFLRNRHLCSDDGSYAEDKPSRLETASAMPSGPR